MKSIREHWFIITISIALVVFFVSMISIGATGELSLLNEPITEMTKGEFMGWTLVVGFLFGGKR